MFQISIGFICSPSQLLSLAFERKKREGTHNKPTQSVSQSRELCLYSFVTYDKVVELTSKKMWRTLNIVGCLYSIICLLHKTHYPCKVSLCCFISFCFPLPSSSDGTSWHFCQPSSLLLWQCSSSRHLPSIKVKSPFLPPYDHCFCK